MPNDLSPTALPSVSDALANRTARYCARARALAFDPSLTMAGAACALDHLWNLQQELSRERLRQARPIKAALREVEDPFRQLEDGLKRARADLSEALLRAKPDPALSLGPIPHGKQADPAPSDEKDATPAAQGAPKAVSVCRALLDLEALRPFLSEAALRQAVEKYTKATGACDVRGVAYAVLPPSSQHDCPVI